jgi:hypothetical protein
MILHVCTKIIPAANMQKEH